MKIAVTGGTGFIGTYVVQSLLDQGLEVLVTGLNQKELSSKTWRSKVEFVSLNIHDLHSEVPLERICQCDKIIHLVWSGLPNYKDLFHFEENLMAQYFFLKKLIIMGMSDITITGTCFEYGMKDGALHPDMDTNPENPYALAKDTLRKFLLLLQTKQDFQLKWVRLFYMYGNGQSPHSILSQLDKALDTGQEVFNMSGGEQLRDYLSVEKVAEKINQVSFETVKYRAYNCASGIPISIRSLVENHLKKRGESIKLNLGYYPYPDFEPMAFWGGAEIKKNS